MSHYFIFAGEASGDLHGYQLIQALKFKDPNAFFEGVGGTLMRSNDFSCFLNTEAFQVMGLSDVLKALPTLWKLFWAVHKKIIKSQPDVVILIDYPGFNLRLAKHLRRKGYRGPIVQYISPTVWAHGKKRIQTLAKYFNLLITILPFEKSFFSDTSLDVIYSGHPLISQISQKTYSLNWKDVCQIPNMQKILAIFPGSRLGEIKRHATIQLHAAKQLIKLDKDLILAISCAHEHLRPQLIQAIKDNQLTSNQVKIIPVCYTHELMKDAYLALAKSGTVALELGLYQVPTVVHYELSALNYAFAKYILRLKLKHYCLVNILAEKEVFPEHIDYQVSANHLIESLKKLYLDEKLRQTIQMTCQTIRNQLQHTQGLSNAIEAIRRFCP